MGYCGGGRNLQTNFSDWYKFDFLANVWTQIADFPDERYECIAFCINGIGYVGLGIDGQGTYYSDFYKYNPILDEWTPVAAFPGDIALYSNAFNLNGKGYVCTGLNGNNNLSSEFWSYDPAKNSWTQLDDFPYPKIKGVSHFNIGGCNYLVTGIDENSTRQLVNYSFCDRDDGTTEPYIYPNPSQGKLTLLSKGDYLIEKVNIFDIQGKVIMELSYSKEYFEIDASTITNGPYLIEITTSEQEIYVKKVVFE